jgi:hypothetical protein
MSADSAKGELAAQEAKFGGFYTWRPSDDSTFFPVSTCLNIFSFSWLEVVQCAL